MIKSIQVPRYSLNDVARVGGVNPSVFRNWQRIGISFFDFEGHATPATGPGKAHKLSGRVAIYMLLSLFISKNGVSPQKAHEVALQYTHFSSAEVSKTGRFEQRFSRDICENYSTKKYTNLVICPTTGRHKYFASDASPTAEEMRDKLGEYLYGVVHINMNMFLDWAKSALQI